jgi:hypothetical protein
LKKTKSRAVLIAATLFVSCAPATGIPTADKPAYTPETSPAILVLTGKSVEGILSPLRPDDWHLNRMSSMACVLLSEYYAPFQHAPSECWKADESEALRCCTWEVDVDQATDDGPDVLRGWANENVPTSTWCTSVEDPCRKWEIGPEDGC